MTARRSFSLVFALAVAASSGLVPAVQAAPAAPEPTGWQRMLAQQPLVNAAEAIQAEIDRISDQGFAGIVLEEDHVALWWKGQVPAGVTAAVATAARQVPVEIEQAAYSNAELQAAAEVIEARKGAKSPVHAVKIPADGSGLVLGTTEACEQRAADSHWGCPARSFESANHTRLRCSVQ